MVSVYQNYKPRGSANFRPGSNPEHGIHAMPKADSVHSTPPANTAKSIEEFPEYPPEIFGKLPGGFILEE
jgi:hypothetical protein